MNVSFYFIFERKHNFSFDITKRVQCSTYNETYSKNNKLNQIKFWTI